MNSTIIVLPSDLFISFNLDGFKYRPWIRLFDEVHMFLLVAWSKKVKTQTLKKQSPGSVL